MEHFISRWLVLTIAAGVMVTLLPGMHAVGEPPILGIGAFALFLALINASIKPIVHTIALPFSILSFGLIALIINWLFMELASWLAISLFDDCVRQPTASRIRRCSKGFRRNGPHGLRPRSKRWTRTRRHR